MQLIRVKTYSYKYWGKEPKYKLREKTQIQDTLKAYQIKGKIINKTCRPIVALDYNSNRRVFF